MALDAPPLVRLEGTFARDLPELTVPWQAAEPPAPRLLVLDESVAADLGLDPDRLRTPEGIGLLTGTVLPDGATPVAQAYSGHQFGGFSPRLGDGRALLLGEVRRSDGTLLDLHLKGSGRTPFARGGDGRAAVGPMLREVVVSAALHANGVPTTRALAVVATGQDVARDAILPGAVLARVASSHIRVGTFQYAALQGGPDLVRRLADHVIARHHPQAADADQPYLALFEAVLDAQASLVAQWMLLGFVHGVMNTDNTTVSGETIDYGPCAFLDAHDPAAVFSSIDHGGRYAYGSQPAILQWNLARLAETLLPLLDPDDDTAIEVATAALHTFPERYRAHHRRGARAKLGLTDEHPDDDALVEDLFALMAAHRPDHTLLFRALASALRDDPAPARSLVEDPAPLDAWTRRHRTRVADPATAAAAMDRVNPLVIPRNHDVEAALDAATLGDLAPFERLLDAVRHPFDDGPRSAGFTDPAPAGSAPHVTFCGT